MLERRRASVQSLLDDVVLAAQELLQDARPPDVTRESLACPVRRTTPSIGVAETEDCAFGHRAMLCHRPRDGWGRRVQDGYHAVLALRRRIRVALRYEGSQSDPLD